jgi:hypothetical protein
MHTSIYFNVSCHTTHVTQLMSQKCQTSAGETCILVYISTYHVTQHMSHNSCQHMSHNTCHTTHVTQHMSHNTCHTTHVTQLMSHNTCHTTHVTQHISQECRSSAGLTYLICSGLGGNGDRPTVGLCIFRDAFHQGFDNGCDVHLRLKQRTRL